MGPQIEPGVEGAFQQAVPGKMKPFLLDTNVIEDALRKRNDRHLLVDHFLDKGPASRIVPITITDYLGRHAPAGGETDASVHEDVYPAQNDGKASHPKKKATATLIKSML